MDLKNAIVIENNNEVMEMDMFIEDKQKICDLLCETLKATENAGHPMSNPVVELRFLKRRTVDENGNTIRNDTVRPIFADGSGKSGHYDVNVDGDSGTSMIKDIVKQFVDRVW